MEEILSQFRGKFLIEVEVPEEVFQVGFLEGDFGRNFIEEYEGRFRADFKKNPTLKNIFRYYGGVVEGGSSFGAVLADQILRKYGLRAATHADIEKINRAGTLNLEPFCEDTGLVLRSGGEPNSYLAKNFLLQMKRRGIKFRSPMVIPLSGLELRLDQDSGYGLSFELTDNSKPFHVPATVLNIGGKFRAEDINVKTGFPKFFKENGERILYARNTGLSRLYFKSAIVSSEGRMLATSYEMGRIIAVGIESISSEKIYNELCSQIDQGYRARLKVLTEKKEKAKKAVMEIMVKKKKDDHEIF
jgi:hypothetical protein